ncbi:MAG: 4-oxalocrotonate tautomerase, partial [Gordonia sp. (in: high G+C Gram-positive bacteria)]
MPQIQLTVPEGALTVDGGVTVQNDLAAVLLKWEGAPDNEFFRSLAWAYLHQLPAGSQI